MTDYAHLNETIFLMTLGVTPEVNFEDVQVMYNKMITAGLMWIDYGNTVPRYKSNTKLAYICISTTSSPRKVTIDSNGITAVFKHLDYLQMMIEQSIKYDPSDTD